MARDSLALKRLAAARQPWAAYSSDLRKSRQHLETVPRLRDSKRNPQQGYVQVKADPDRIEYELTPAQWGPFLPERVTATSLLDRLLHHAPSRSPGRVLPHTGDPNRNKSIMT